MRHIILLDKKIATTQYKKWLKDDIAFWEKHLGITPTYEVISTETNLLMKEIAKYGITCRKE